MPLRDSFTVINKNMAALFFPSFQRLTKKKICLSHGFIVTTLRPGKDCPFLTWGMTNPTAPQTDRSQDSVPTKSGPSKPYLSKETLVPGVCRWQSPAQTLLGSSENNEENSLRQESPTDTSQTLSQDGRTATRLQSRLE